MSGPCSACSHFDRDDPKVSEKFKRAGFGLCSERPAWALMSSAAVCCFEPSRFVARVTVPAQTASPVDKLPEELHFG